ncbi:hypothetical protein niasHT_029553 [Heterodera trifolii]|uniref:Uncharacterized protein n=1 Tax=Heterodera trifolii TaxID=157864 RepID=A0ABD2JB57_9BILA
MDPKQIQKIREEIDEETPLLEEKTRADNAAIAEWNKATSEKAEAAKEEEKEVKIAEEEFKKAKGMAAKKRAEAAKEEKIVEEEFKKAKGMAAKKREEKMKIWRESVSKKNATKKEKEALAHRLKQKRKLIDAKSAEGTSPKKVCAQSAADLEPQEGTSGTSTGGGVLPNTHRTASPSDAVLLPADLDHIDVMEIDTLRLTDYFPPDGQQQLNFDMLDKAQEQKKDEK